MSNIVPDYSPAAKSAEALRQAGKKRTQESVEKAEKAIRQLIKDGGSINFSSVARNAGVSTKFLHQNEELAQRIHTLSTQQKGKPPRRLAEAKETGDSPIIAVLKKELENEKQRTKQLRKQIEELEDANQKLLGRLIQYETYMD